MPLLPYIPVISSTLPPPTGPYGVGYAVVHAPAQIWYRPSPVFKDSSPRAGEPALRIIGSTFAIYYPTDTRGGRAQWIPDPVGGVLAGYGRYFGAGEWLLPIVSGAASRYQVPVSPNAPLRPTDKPYPLVIFSHGICGTLTTYSQWAANLASEGYVVLAIEHADGSGPYVVLPDGDGELPLTIMRELEWDDSPDSNPTPTSSSPSSTASSIFLGLSGLGKVKRGKAEADLRALQLDQRVREVYAAHAAFSNPSNWKVDGLDEAKRPKWTASFAEQVDSSRPALAGHSFGASTVFRALEAPPDDYKPLDVSAALALDHWWEPFAPLGDRPPIVDPPPILAINSQEYTLASQWPFILEDCQKAQASLVTIIGTNHESFCDFPVIVTASLATDMKYLKTIHQLSLALLKGSLDDKLGTPDGGKFPRTCFGKMAGRRGEVVTHLRGNKVQESQTADTPKQ
ncbi:hypothetical protein CcaverHIS002_0102030 [Cutaneotrichosporon cavernicola]|uniref:1-alkyl-2-acetylglycerophosphocholine esterase n=1 Tax=Cutaneotrichosporon cavernicola TaxID=279322 RepID=A0AA48I5L8_9TREE|nr:uncharacterized protein CcaverHIS019_0101980 [Cutaneotrichosporon cavernicola]BEI79674.1 hypothetical protein CcaverHIS002_0102030 [Cutaneotrichosporon cavernicola]BEI87480.1 hypothetical protein CcaverHIS019_0101980 [Cutaneotrichosporon cavernicola]BEI95251.1 hypothetical protein CcaverHIS631_0102000 [Cutaneotrichosporon cavernicola]BEJ03024.1 hypothetical protein CcaverHIS641_0101990 [Cutaneotrichosporon cavernicola]